MAVATRPRSGWDWHSPWFFALVGLVLLVAGTLGVGFGTGLLGGGGGTPPPPPSHSPAATASPLETPSPSPLPSASPTPPSVVAQLHGKIAVSNGQPGSGGWISFPGGQFTADPASSVSMPGGGWYGLTQSLALNRWLPVPRDWVTPDGKSYVYTSYWSVYILTAGQAPRALNAPILSSGVVDWQILAATSTGVYVTPPPWDSTGGGLYRIGYTGDPRLVTKGGYWTATDGTYAYGSRSTNLPQGAANTIVRLTIASGAMQDVFSQPGMTSTVQGLDTSGAPVILAVESKPQPTLAQLWIAGAGGPTKLFEATINPGSNMNMGPAAGFTVFSVVPDTFGTWIATSKGLYLYSKEAGFEFASPVTGPLASAFRRG